MGIKKLRGLAPNEPRVCIGCNEMKPADDFSKKYVAGYKYRNRRCKPCMNAKLRARKRRLEQITRAEREQQYGPPNPARVAEFWSNVFKGPGCWIWTGLRSGKGYGVFSMSIAGRHYEKAHRVSWALERGDIPGGLHVLHGCDNSRCVNPDHLRLGTNAENTEDRKRTGRQITGERNGRAKLTPEIVQQIRASNRPDTEWAAELGVHSTTINSARRGKKWAHLN